MSSATNRKPKSEFFRHVFTLGTGTAIAQAIPVLISPVLTRFYSPNAFGTMALFMSLSAILGVAANGKYEFAILLPEEDDAAFTIVCLCFLLLLLTTFILSLVFIGFSDELGHATRIDQGLLLMVPAAVFFIGAFRVLTLWFNRCKHYKTLSVGRILQTSTTAVLGVLFGLWGFYRHGLIWAILIGYGLVDLLLALMLIWENHTRWDRVSGDGMLNAARKHSNFPKYTVLSSLVEMGTMRMPLLLFPILFNPAVAGWFALSQRVTKTPLNLIDRAVRDVFRQQASRDFREHGDCRDLFVAALKRLSFVSVLPFAGLFVLAPELFSFAFGEEWRVAGHYTRIMVLSYWLQFISNPLSSVLMISGKQRLNMFLQIITLAGVMISIFTGYHLGSIVISLYLIMASGVLKYVLQLMAAYTYSSREALVLGESFNS